MNNSVVNSNDVRASQPSDHWATRKLRHLLEVNPSTPAKLRVKAERLVPFVPMEALGEDGTLDATRTRPVGELLTGYSYFANGDVLMAKVTPCFENGKAALVEELPDEHGFGSTEVTTLRTSTELGPAFLYYLVRSDHFRQDSIASMTGAGGLKRVPDEHIRSFETPIPPVPEQRQIADFLDRETAKIDALIDKQEQLIAALREDRAATIAHAVTKGLNPDVEMKDSGVERLGHIPTHWTVPQIGWHSRVGNGSTPARDNQEYWLNGLVPWLNSGHVNRDRITDADQFVTNSAVLECHLPMVPAGSVLVGLTGQGKTRGMASLLMVPSTINQHLAYVTPISRQIGAAYLCYAIRSSYDYLREISEENGSTKGGLTCSALKKLRIPIPPKNEQDMLVRFLDERCSKIDSLIAKSTEMIDTLREYRSALITNAVTGKIDVREAV